MIILVTALLWLVIIQSTEGFIQTYPIIQSTAGFIQTYPIIPSTAGFIQTLSKITARIPPGLLKILG